MTKNSTIKDVELVLPEAEWMARLQEGSLGKNMSDAEKQAFKEWLNENPDNPDKFDACLEAWALSKDLENHSDIMMLLGEEVPELSEHEAPVQKKYLHLIYGSVAACFMLIALSFVVLQYGSSPNSQMQYQTGIGEQTVYTLPDGSRVHMNTDTRLSLNFTAKGRELRLLRGEAAFDVVHDKARPFDVLSGKGRVRAIGTRFNVFNNGEKVTISVLEGVVQVSSASDMKEISEAIGPKLIIGQQMSYNNKGAMSEVKDIDVAKIQTWQQGRLEFLNAPLSDVISEMNRYSPTPIIIGDDSLLLLKVSGIFDVRDAGSMLGGLEDILPVKLQINNNKFILVSVKEKEGI